MDFLFPLYLVLVDEPYNLQKKIIFEKKTWLGINVSLKIKLHMKKKVERNLEDC